MAAYRMSAQEYRVYIAQNSKKKTKHRNNIVYVFSDGFVSTSKEDAQKHGKISDKFDSEKEYQRWAQLRLLERSGKISGLKKQVPIPIFEEFSGSDGKKHRAIQYKADFVYIEDGKEIVEDVKGFDRKSGKYLMTETFRLKWKLLIATYPEKVFRLF